MSDFVSGQVIRVDGAARSGKRNDSDDVTLADGLRMTVQSEPMKCRHDSWHGTEIIAVTVPIQNVDRAAPMPGT